MGEVRSSFLVGAVACWIGVHLLWAVWLDAVSSDCESDVTSSVLGGAAVAAVACQGGVGVGGGGCAHPKLCHEGADLSDGSCGTCFALSTSLTLIRACVAG